MASTGAGFLPHPAADAACLTPPKRTRAAGPPAAVPGAAIAVTVQEVIGMSESGFPVGVARGVPVVTAPEEIDAANAAGLRAALLDAAARANGRLVVDMSGTQFCDSATLNVLVRAHQRARANGRELLLIITGDTVLRIFALTGVDRVIPNFPTLEQALAPPPTTVLGSPGLPGPRPGACAPPGDVQTPEPPR